MATAEHFSPEAKLKRHGNIYHDLGSKLSPNATIVNTTANAPRWSDYNAPLPGAVVNVAVENDVVETIRYCTENRIEFTAQTGAHGWISSWHIGSQDLIINMRGLNSVKVNTSSSTITFGGGSIISEVVAAADAAGYQVATGNCNCVGTMGAILGGGIGHFQGLYGLGVDNIASMNVATGDGQLHTINSESGDLWWAMRGTGPNFGVVTLVTMKAYKQPNRNVWTGPLVFTEDKIESIVTAIDNLELAKPMSIFLYFATMGPPSYKPTVLVAPFYAGSEADGRAAFASIFALGPVQDNTTVLPYTSANIANDPFCVDGGRKPSYGASLAVLTPSTWRSIWNLYTEYVSDTRVAKTSVFVECYSWVTARQFPVSSSSFPFRDTINYTALVNNDYTDASLDSKAEAFGSQVRNLWRQTDGLALNSTYINFAFGDESLQTVYGQNVERLQQIKKRYDPFNKFDQWFPLLGRNPNTT